MRVLVLGGTAFLSRAVAARARDRGHEVTCAARGVSGEPPPGVRFVRVDRAVADGLAPLAGEGFDAVVDVARQSVSQVRAALAALGPRAGHWTYVSSRSVYADKATPGQSAATAPLLDPAPADADEDDPAEYGRLKVAAERAVLDALGDRAFMVRPGLIVGAGDPSDRYGYWPARMARGGEVLCPGEPAATTQIIDVEDLAAWMVLAVEERLTGVFDATSEPTPMGDVLGRTAAVCGHDAVLTWVTEAFLLGEGVEPWMGRRSLPLWLPRAASGGFGSWDVGASIGAGLRLRPIEATAAATLAWERRLGLGRPRSAGLTTADEAELLTRWHASPRPA